MVSRFFPRTAIATIPPTLQSGMTGEPVRMLQMMLVREDLNIPTDGVFGTLTERAVRDFQEGQQITVDGIVGPETWMQFEDCGNQLFMNVVMFGIGKNETMSG